MEEAYAYMLYRLSDLVFARLFVTAILSRFWRAIGRECRPSLVVANGSPSGSISGKRRHLLQLIVGHAASEATGGSTVTAYVSCGKSRALIMPWIE